MLCPEVLRPRRQLLEGLSFAPALQGTPQRFDTSRPVILQGVKRWGVIQETPNGLHKLTLKVNANKRERLAAGEEVKRNGARLVELRDDPGERTDLKGDQAATADQLFGILEALGAGNPLAQTAERDDITVQDEEALRAMGYVE